MGQLLLYVPGRATPHTLEKLGLSALLGGGAPLPIETPHGPDGGQGTTFTWIEQASLALACYQPERQTWQPCKPLDGLGRAAGAVWFGWNTGNPPGPNDLRHRRQRPGIWATLSNGTQWLIPVARRLPSTWGLGDDGRFAPRVLPEYRDFCRRAERFAEALLASDNQSVSLEDAWAYCIQALAINYRINEDLADALNLLVVEESLVQGVPVEVNDFRTIALATLEYEVTQQVEADQKKTA